MGRSVFKVRSSVTLKSGSEIEKEDFVSVIGGMLVAAKRVQDHYMKLQFKDQGKWSDVTKVKAHHCSHVCDLL